MGRPIRLAARSILIAISAEAPRWPDAMCRSASRFIFILSAKRLRVFGLSSLSFITIGVVPVDPGCVKWYPAICFSTPFTFRRPLMGEITAIFGIGAAMFIIGIVVTMWGLQRAYRDERRRREETK